MKLKCQRKASSLRFARKRYGYDGPRPVIEYIMTENQHRATPGLFIALDQIEIRPPNLAS